MLSKIREAIDRELANGYEVTKIRLTQTSHKQLKKELTKQDETQKRQHLTTTSIFGIPVIVDDDDGFSTDTLLILEKKTGIQLPVLF